jgi:hypothetical protein
MSIVRQDRRQPVRLAIANLRDELDQVLIMADTLRTSIDQLAIQLGLENPQEQSEMSQMVVMHMPKGDKQPHTVDECDEHCITDKSTPQEVVEGVSLLEQPTPETTK